MQIHYSDPGYLAGSNQTEEEDVLVTVGYFNIVRLNTKLMETENSDFALDEMLQLVGSSAG